MRARTPLVFLVSAMASGMVAAPSIATPDSTDSFGGPTMNKRFAGWELRGTDGNFTMTTTIRLPKLHCTKARQAIVPSVGGFTSSNPTKKFSAAGVFVGCSAGKAGYYPTFTLDGTIKSYPKLSAHAGDAVVLTANLNFPSTTLSVVDKTTKSASKTVTGKGITSTGFPFVGDLPWPTTASSRQGVPDFGTLTFNHTDFVGSPFGPSRGSLIQLFRRNAGTVQITTSHFSHGGETFKTIFKHS